ncbi:MAG: single-stranded DNA-binding protein [Bacteroidota bacterium]|nr:single-stranded DNA-binding protein [Bacteroidota bacterium]
MASGVNKVILLGNLGKDPEVKHLESGAVVAHFTLATTEVYKDKNGERQSKTEWHNVVFWRRLAEIIEQYVKKGDQVYLEGKISTRSYNDKDGNKKFFTEIVGNSLTMLGKKGGDDPSQSQQSKNEAAKSVSTEITEEQGDDDLPF